MSISARTWARIGAVAFIAFAALVSALSLRRDHQSPAAPGLAPAVDPAAADPLVAELYRCQALGQAGASDADCLRAWAENRRRFLAPGAIPEAPMPPAPPAALDRPGGPQSIRPAQGDRP